MLLQISAAGGMQKGTNGDESDERLRTENSYIDNRHKHTIIATCQSRKAVNSQALMHNEFVEPGEGPIEVSTSRSSFTNSLSVSSEIDGSG